MARAATCSLNTWIAKLSGMRFWRLSKTIRHIRLICVFSFPKAARVSKNTMALAGGIGSSLVLPVLRPISGMSTTMVVPSATMRLLWVAAPLLSVWRKYEPEPATEGKNRSPRFQGQRG